MAQIPIILVVLLLLLGCGVPGPQRVQIHVQSPHWDMRDPLSRATAEMLSRGPGTPFSSISDFDCFFVSVVGKGVPTIFDDGFAPPTGSVLDPSCLGFGRVSRLVSLETLRDKGISMELESGNERVIKVGGFSPPRGLTAATCDGQTFQQTAVDNQQTAPMFFRLGEVKVDLTKDAVVSIPSLYKPAVAKEMEADCPSHSLTLVPKVFYHGAMEGDASGPKYDDVLINAGNPINLPPSTSSAAGSMVNFQTIGPGSVFHGGELASAMSEHARVDVLFDVTGIDLTPFNSMRVRMIAGGGLDSGGGDSIACNTSATVKESTVNGYELRVWKPNAVGSGGWVGAKTVLEHDVELQSFNFTAIPPSAVAVFEKAADTTVASGKYIHFTLRSRAGISAIEYPTNNGGACSAIGLELMTLRLIP